jgi:hypothetical protein
MAAISFGKVPINRYNRKFPNGETPRVTHEICVCRCGPREVKHLSTWRKRKQIKGLSFWSNLSRKGEAIEIRKKVLAMPLVAASETGIAQTVRVYMYGVVGRQLGFSSRRVTKRYDNKTCWKARPQKVIVLYVKL